MIAGERAQEQPRELFADRLAQPRDPRGLFVGEARAVVEDPGQRPCLRLEGAHGSNIGAPIRPGNPSRE
jgi:hypothetical protein